MRHRRSHARAVQAGAATQNCKFCGQEFVNNKILMRHIITNHESQQMDYLAASLHSQKKEDDPKERHERLTTEDPPLSAKKPTSAPKLLLPGFFHPTLKKGPFVEETHAKKRSAFEQKNGVIKNLAKLKETNYFVIDKSVDGGNVVKIITSEGKKHNSIPNDIANNEEDGERSVDITESLDRMLEEFEKEEREERERESCLDKEATKGAEANEDLAAAKEGKDEDKNRASSEEDAVSDKEEKNSDKKLPAKERSPSEGEFLNISFHDEILMDDRGSCGKKRKLAIVKDSKVIGRLTTSSQFRPPESHAYPSHSFLSHRSVSDQYEQFWTKIGLVPKIKQRTVDRKVAKRKNEQQKRHLMVSSGGEPKINNPCSPTKSICMKKFPSEGFSSPDTGNRPSSVRALTTQTKHNASLKCDICSEGFLDNDFLLQHVQEKHPKLSKSDKSVLKKEVPPHKSCDVRKFKEGKWQVNNSLSPETGGTKIKTVVQNMCKEDKTESLTNQQIQLQKKVKDGLGNPEGKLQCVSCEFRTNFNWYLKKHTLSKHKDVKDYEFFCSKCDFKTNFKWNLKKHWNNKHSGCYLDLRKPKDDEDRFQKNLTEVKKRKGMEEAESIETKASRSKNGSSPKHDKNDTVRKDRINEKSSTKKRKDAKRVKGKSAGGFIDKKLSEVPELNPYSRQLSCSRKEGGGGGERDLDEERKRNVVESLTEPYCRLCQLLLEPELRFGLMGKGEGVAAKLPKHSVVWVPNRKEGNGVSVNEENEEDEEEEESVISRLLVCSSCKLCVHRTCYLLPEKGNSDGWTCQACSLPPSAACSLCQQPGGLLQRTDRGRLIHLDCALLLPETTITGEGRLSLRQVPEKRRCLECVICGGQESQPGVHCQVRSGQQLVKKALESEFAGKQSVSGGISPWLRATLRSRHGGGSAGPPHPSLWILCGKTWSQGASGRIWGQI